MPRPNHTEQQLRDRVPESLRAGFDRLRCAVQDLGGVVGDVFHPLGAEVRAKALHYLQRRGLTLLEEYVEACEPQEDVEDEDSDDDPVPAVVVREIEAAEARLEAEELAAPSAVEPEPAAKPVHAPVHRVFEEQAPPPKPLRRRPSRAGSGPATPNGG